MDAGESGRRAVLVACCIAAFIAPVLSTMMNLSLISIGADFGVGSHDQAYINTSFLLCSVMFMVPMAKVGDIIGKKRTFVIGVSVILAGTVAAALSPWFWFLILCRGAIGAGAAALACTSVSMISDVYAGGRGGALGLHTMCTYIGLSIGPPLGGVLNQFFGWRSLFIVAVPFALLSLAVISRFPGDMAPDKGGRFDAGSAAVYGVAMLLSMSGVINLPEPWAAAAMVAGLLLLLLFVRMQLHGGDLMDMRLFRNRMFTGSCVAAFLAYAASYSVSFFMALYLQSIGGLSSSEAGMLMLVQPGVQAVFTPLFGGMSDRMRDVRVLPTAGMAILAVGILSLTTYGLDASMPQIVLTMVVVGFGFSVFSAPNVSAIMSSVPPAKTGEASAMVSFMRQTGMMVSMGTAMVFITAVMGSADNLMPATYGSFLDVMSLSFGACALMCVLGIACSLLRGRTCPVD